MKNMIIYMIELNKIYENNISLKMIIHKKMKEIDFDLDISISIYSSEDWKIY